MTKFCYLLNKFSNQN